jgi:hypothetical protein
MRQIFIVVAVTLLLAACTRLHSNVSTYSNIQDGYQGKTIAIAPLNDEQANSMEFWDFARRVEARFAAKGDPST